MCNIGKKKKKIRYANRYINYTEHTSDICCAQLSLFNVYLTVKYVPHLNHCQEQNVSRCNWGCQNCLYNAKQVEVLVTPVFARFSPTYNGHAMQQTHNTSICTNEGTI